MILQSLDGGKETYSLEIGDANIGKAKLLGAHISSRFNFFMFMSYQ